MTRAGKSIRFASGTPLFKFFAYLSTKTAVAALNASIAVCSWAFFGLPDCRVLLGDRGDSKNGSTGTLVEWAQLLLPFADCIGEVTRIGANVVNGSS